MCEYVIFHVKDNRHDRVNDSQLLVKLDPDGEREQFNVRSNRKINEMNEEEN